MRLVRGMASILLASLALPACSTPQQTGRALVAAGAITAVVAAEAATGYCRYSQGFDQPCQSSTSRPAAQKAAAAGVAAGVAMAVAGHAIQERARGRDNRPVQPPASSPRATWTLAPRKRSTPSPERSEKTEETTEQPGKAEPESERIDSDDRPCHPHRAPSDPDTGA